MDFDELSKNGYGKMAEFGVKWVGSRLENLHNSQLSNCVKLASRSYMFSHVRTKVLLILHLSQLSKSARSSHLQICFTHYVGQIMHVLQPGVG